MSDSPAVRAATVEGVGTFTFGKRNMRAQMKISVEFARLTEGVHLDAFNSMFFHAVAELNVLTVSAPDGWDIDEMDPNDDESYARVFRVRGALLDSEGGPFRGSGEAVPPGGEAPSGNV